MKIGFKWPSRTRTAATTSSRSRTTRAPRGRAALTAKKPAAGAGAGWTIRINPFAPKTLAQIGEWEDDDFENLDYLAGFEAAQVALEILDEASDDFVQGFYDGVMSTLPDDTDDSDEEEE